MKYYYANAANQPTGPVTLDELRLLLSRGEITTATNIIPVGETVWRPLASVLAAPATAISPSTNLSTPVADPAFSPASGSPPPPAPASSRPALKPADVAKLPTILASFIGGIIRYARAFLSPARLNALFSGANALGQVLVLIGAVLVFIYGIVYAIKYNSFQIFLTALGAVLLLAVLQFVAKRLLDACASILTTSPTRVASLAVLECFGLLMLLGALVLLVQGIVSAIQLESFLPLIPILLAAAVLIVAGGVALHPSLAHVEEAPASAGEEAIGLFSFFAKTLLVLQPLLFAVYAGAGVLVVLLAIFGKDAGIAYAMLAFIPFQVPGVGGLAGAGLLASACLLPLFAYLSFLAYYLLIDVLRAILVIPVKLDQLRR